MIKIGRPPLPSLKRSVPGMTLNCIWWGSSSSEDLERVEYPFIAITPRSTLIRTSSIYGLNWSILELLVLDTILPSLKSS